MCRMPVSGLGMKPRILVTESHDTRVGVLQKKGGSVDTRRMHMRLSHFATGVALITLAATCGNGSGGSGHGGTTAASSPKVGGCSVFPATNAWNTDISKQPVSSRSAAYIAEINGSGASAVHPDF